MTDRIRLSRRARVRIFDRQHSICHLCGIPIWGSGEAWDIDHILPLHLGGTNDERNLAPVHKECHEQKNAAENPIRSKTDRQRANYLGIERLGPKLPAGRNDPFRKKITGEVVPRLFGKGAKHRQTMAGRYHAEFLSKHGRPE